MDGRLYIEQNGEVEAAHKIRNEDGGMSLISGLIEVAQAKSQRQSPEGRLLTKEEHEKFLRHINEQKRMLRLER